MNNTELIRELKKQIDLYFLYKEIGDSIAAKLTADTDAERPVPPEEEAAEDMFYKKEYAAFNRAAEIINELTGSKIDIKTARQMINTLGADITNLLENSKAVKEAQA